MPTGLSIVGSDLRLVERVTGRLTVLRAALLGAAAGGWIGLLIGLVFWIVSPGRSARSSAPWSPGATEPPAPAQARGCRLSIARRVFRARDQC